MTGPSKTALGAAPDDIAAVEAIVKAAGTSFYRGMRVLPPDRRTAMYAVYAFCRIVDDIVDEDTPFDDKLPRLGEWRARIDALFDQPAGALANDHPVARVLRPAIAAFTLRRQDFVDLIDGMQMDGETTIVAPTLAELDLYCDRVAASVGRLSVRCFGDGSPAADRVAHALGRALQLTNVLRDLQEDADRGRLYLPREWLEDAGVPLHPHAALASPNLKIVCARVAALAHEQFRAAATTMRECDPRAMRPARLMGATYDAILSALERRGWSDPAHRVSLPVWRKVLIAARYGFV